MPILKFITLNGNLNPHITQQGLSSDDFDIIAGGYSQIGRLVIINIRVNTKKEIVKYHDAIIKGFPAPHSDSHNYVQSSENRKRGNTLYSSVYVNYNGLIANPAENTVPENTTSLFSATYIT